ncbi:MAG: hypothetical protein ACREPD_02025 [Stenotrophomonas sp.]|uniref:hypothetical protein n=1 Tax=Stenotrophomonas sp. TaxID=69392 RepID=UPI003D6D4264
MAVAEDQEPISTVEVDSSMEGWDGVTYVIFAAERQCLPEDYEGRLAVATQAIGQPWRHFDLHDPTCPRIDGGPCCCGLVSVFTNDRWVAYVDMSHAVQAVHSIQ